MILEIDMSNIQNYILNKKKILHEFYYRTTPPFLKMFLYELEYFFTFICFELFYKSLYDVW